MLMGDITNWTVFERQRDTASQIVNRQIARSISSQINRGYRELSNETEDFISKNFIGCGFRDLARLCDDVKARTGISMCVDEFEKAFFSLAERVKRLYLFYADVPISIYGLKFEFPEHLVLRAIETSLPDLLETRSQLAPFARP